MSEVPARSPRLVGIDALRGLVMVLMALDHVRDFFGSLAIDPHDLSVAPPGLFLTRWITHFCAPTFVCLAGVSAWLYRQRCASTGAFVGFLVSRGVWLVFLGLTVIQFGWTHDLRLASFFGVVSAIGTSMVGLAILAGLSTRVLLGIGVAILAGHGLLSGIDPNEVLADTPWATWGRRLWIWLFAGSMAGQDWIFIRGHFCMVIYPVIPWLGVLLVGYGLGPLTQLESTARRRIFATTGLVLLLLFGVLRGLNGYGDPVPRIEDGSLGLRMMSFLNTSKYPPSLAYLLMTLGPAFLLLSAFDRKEGPLQSILVTFGRVPLFYYVVHLHLIHATSRSMYWILRDDPISPMGSQFSQPPPSDPLGYDLGVVYLAWLGIVLVLYPACIAYGRIKRRGRSRIWSYL